MLIKSIFAIGSNVRGGPWGYARAVEKGRCALCGAISTEAVHSMVLRIQRRNRWPDAFGIDSYHGFVVQERVVADLLDSGVNVKSIPVEFEWLGSGPEPATPPRYFHLMPERGVDLDLAGSGIIASGKCPA